MATSVFSVSETLKLFSFVIKKNVTFVNNKKHKIKWLERFIIKMNQYAILHIPDSRYCFAVGEKELVLRLRMSKEDDGAKVYLIYAQKYDFTLKRQKKRMEVCYRDYLYSYYEIRLTLKDVRFAYLFEIEEAGKIYYFSEDGVTKNYCFEEGFYNFFQMPYINQNDVLKTVDWMRDAVFYQIFIDRFYQGNMQKDTGYINMAWGDKPTPESFAGGDIEGIIEKLDYLQKLGVTALYLTPVFSSVSNHKYDIKDYRKVDPQFGTKEDVIRLVKKAHEKGIRIVLDAVFNHCSMYLEQFMDVIKKGQDSIYFDWFLINGNKVDVEKGNYECFASCNYMPKLNTANEQVQEFLIEIAAYWMRETGIDGWRLDVSDEVSHDFWRRFRKEVKKINPDCVIIGENWHDAYPYLQGDQYDSIMNYSFTKACLDYFAREKFDAKAMAEKLNANLMRNLEQVNVMMLNLLDSHDTHRFFSEVGCDKRKLLAALALEIVFIGTPCIYYGTEICMEGGYDPDSRRCFDWEKTHWDMAVYDKIKELLALKKEEVLQYGTICVLEEDGMLFVHRTWKNVSITLWVNGTDQTKKITFSKSDTKKIICAENELEWKKNPKEERNCINEPLFLQSKGFVVVKEEMGV